LACGRAAAAAPTAAAEGAAAKILGSEGGRRIGNPASAGHLAEERGEGGWPAGGTWCGFVSPAAAAVLTDPNASLSASRRNRSAMSETPADDVAPCDRVTSPVSTLPHRVLHKLAVVRCVAADRTPGASAVRSPGAEPEQPLPLLLLGSAGRRSCPFVEQSCPHALVAAGSVTLTTCSRGRPCADRAAAGLEWPLCLGSADSAVCFVHCTLVPLPLASSLRGVGGEELRRPKVPNRWELVVWTLGLPGAAPASPAVGLPKPSKARGSKLAMCSTAGTTECNFLQRASRYATRASRRGGEAFLLLGESHAHGGTLREGGKSPRCCQHVTAQLRFFINLNRLASVFFHDGSELRVRTACTFFETCGVHRPIRAGGMTLDGVALCAVGAAAALAPPKAAGRPPTPFT
jgi:hypothetical protein